MIQSTSPSQLLSTASPDVVANDLRERYQRLTALDNSPQDQDPRESYISVSQSRGQLEAIAYSVADGFEYQARIRQGSEVVAGECATVSQNGSDFQILSSHYEATGQRQVGPGFPDITQPSDTARSLTPPNVSSTEQCRQWSSQGEQLTLLATDPKDESYFYGHNFDLMFRP